METNGKYYLGRVYDAQAGEVTDRPLLYDPDDLTTHGVVVGMTGSGKTGLCIDLLEEAALNGTPALMIDPKGDITNALLHFPGLAAADFAPWVNADQARREGKTVEQAAADAAALWRNGLAEWGIGPERIQALKDAAHFAVYTPGSDAGRPVNIVASLAAPAVEWEGHREALREQISATVSAILGLAGLREVDPLRSREHILLANIFEHAWSQGRDLSLKELILQTQSPPFGQLGVFEVDAFFPPKDRSELAMGLNGILASPSFGAWVTGEPLDVGRLLVGADGRPRHAVFYIAHLNDEERMFFVALLYAAVDSWMRSQPGTTGLRALVYFDEIFGYLPPVANPPSKTVILRLLKTARAFGVGLLLATQNPVDVDYKALSNAGTWFIGRLQTDQDKQRLLDGLSSAAGGLDRPAYDRLLSGLGKRVFLLHNVHEKQPVLFQTRWAMNYLAGPLTRSQIPALNALAGAAAAEPAAAGMAAAMAAAGGGAGTSQTRPAAPVGVAEYFLPANLTLSEAARGSAALAADARPAGLLYRPALLAQAAVHVVRREYDLAATVRRAAIVPAPDPNGLIDWERQAAEPVEPRDLDPRPAPEARFAALAGGLSDGRALKALERDFEEWVYRSTTVKVRAVPELKVFAGPEVSDEAFAGRVEKAIAAVREDEAEKVAAQLDRKIKAAESKLAREERDLRAAEDEHSRRKRNELATHAETLFGLLTKRRRSVSPSFSKRSMTERARDTVAESKEEIEELQEEIEELQEEKEEALEELALRWEEVADTVETVEVKPYKKDVAVELFGVAWAPYYVVEAGGREVELVAYAAGR